MAALPVASVGSSLSEEAIRVVEEELPFRILFDGGPSDDVISRLRELTLRVRIVRGVHQDIVAEEVSDIVEHVLPFVVLDAAEEAAARHVFAGLLLERGGAADVDRLFVHAPSPEREPSEAAFEHPHPELRVLVEET